MFYQILPDRKVPQVYLTYSYDKELILGHIVEIAIRGGTAFGIVIKELTRDEIDFDLDKVKGITSVLPFVFGKEEISFIFLMSQNTFNSINLITDSSLQFLELLNQKEMENFKLKYESREQNYTKKIVENKIIEKPIFYLETKEIPTTVRIRYIIRINIDLFPTKSTQLVIFPEKKLLEKEYEKFGNLVEKDESIQLSKFTGEKLKHSKQTLKNILENSNKHNVIFSTRAGIFLPYSNLTQIILIDEANSFHIQDQNQIYYDTRDAVFFLSQAYNCSLSFISTTPSVRLSQFY